MTPSKYRLDLWRQKTIIDRLSCDVVFVILRLAVSINIDMLQTDGLTEKHMHYLVSIASRGKNHVQTSRDFLNMLPVTVAWVSSDENAISYVLPVFVDNVMFSQRDHMACGACNIDVGAALQQVVISLQCIRPAAPRCPLCCRIQW